MCYAKIQFMNGGKNISMLVSVIGNFAPTTYKVPVLATLLSSFPMVTVVLSSTLCYIPF